MYTANRAMNGMWPRPYGLCEHPKWIKEEHTTSTGSPQRSWRYQRFFRSNYNHMTLSNQWVTLHESRKKVFKGEVQIITCCLFGGNAVKKKTQNKTNNLATMIIRMNKVAIPSHTDGRTCGRPSSADRPVWHKWKTRIHTSHSIS